MFSCPSENTFETTELLDSVKIQIKNLKSNYEICNKVIEKKTVILIYLHAMFTSNLSFTSHNI